VRIASQSNSTRERGGGHRQTNAIAKAVAPLFAEP
jgi:hypothetical protein